MDKPKSYQEVLELPDPKDIKFNKIKHSELIELLNYYLESLENLLLKYEDVVKQEIEYTCYNCKSRKTITGRVLLSKLFYTYVIYYGHLAQQSINLALSSKIIYHEGLSVERQEQLEIKMTSWTRVIKENKNLYKSSIEATVLFGYTIVYSSIHFFQTAYIATVIKKGILDNQGVDKIEFKMHSILGQIFSLTEVEVNSMLQECLKGMLKIMLSINCSIYKPTNGRKTKPYKTGAYSNLKLKELESLASRDEDVKAKYGLRKIDKIFEQQLSLLFQSFGFITITSNRGDKTVDLICISNDPRGKMTILIEAKSSKKPYTLPTKDERALRDYVNDVQKNLTTFPDLTAILIIGPSDSKTLSSKIGTLQNKIHIPIRFIDAGELVELREQIIGPLSPNIFKDIIEKSDYIVKDLAVKVMDEQTKIQISHDMLVKTSLSGATLPNHLDLLKLNEKNSKLNDCE